MMNRPYCLQELKDIESELHDKYRLSSIFAQHYPCGHKYRVKKGGRKEQFILDSNTLQTSLQVQKPEVSVLDDQTCSVCFKLRTSIDKPTMNFIDNIKVRDIDDSECCIDIEFLKQKTNFYKWLFQHDY
jgi:hypothetical protein